MEQQFLDFVSKIGVMKPATVDEDNEKDLVKLQTLLLSPDYDIEEKVDGCHYVIFGFRFFSTEGNEKTANYPHLTEPLLAQQFPNIILDGECHYPGKTSQYATRVTGSSPDVAIAFQQKNGFIHYTMWDILRTPKGTWLLNKTYRERRQILEQYYNTYIKGTEMAKYVHIADRRTTGKKEFYEEIIASGREGCVLKKIDSFYIMGKKPKWQWMKLKQKDEADFFVTGYEPAKVKYTGTNFADWPYWDDIDGDMIPVTKFHHFGWIGAIELSAYVNGVVTKVCTCSGLTEDMRASISENRDIFLNKVVKVEFMETTEANYPRHPRFKMFHESKTPIECTWELAE